MFINKKELLQLSDDVRKLIDGEHVDIRDNREGAFSILKNDIYTLADIKNESLDAIQNEKESLKNTLADISHQLKTPLTGMLLMVDLLENNVLELQEKLQPESELQSKSESEMQSKSEKMSELLSNLRSELTKTEWLAATLLRLAKLDAGAIKLNPAKNSLHEIAGMAVNSVQILLELKGQTVEIATENANAAESDVENATENMAKNATKNDVFVNCDKLWTIEALTNIIKNGGEHSPVGSNLKIEIGENPICAWLSVTDCGEGIKNARDIFKRWSSSGSGSGSDSLGNGSSGYGLGLPLALRIMQLQSGDIVADGNVFTLKFYKE